MSNFRTEDVYLEHSKDRKSVTIKNRRGANLENLTALEILELHEKGKELDRMQKNAQLPDRQRLQNKIRNQRKELKNMNIKVQECACIDEFLRLEHPHQFEENTTTLDRVKHLSRSYQQERLVRTNENSAQIHYDIVTNIPKDLVTVIELQQSEGVTIGKAVASTINNLIDNRDHYKSLANSYEKKLHDKKSPLNDLCAQRLDKIRELQEQAEARDSALINVYENILEDAKANNEDELVELLTSKASEYENPVHAISPTIMWLYSQRKRFIEYFCEASTKVEELQKQVDYYEKYTLYKSDSTFSFKPFPKYGVPTQPKQEAKKHLTLELLQEQIDQISEQLKALKC